MNPEIKAQWVAALRSGEYKQGRRRLRDCDSFCCLGVLCDLHAKATGGEWAIHVDVNGDGWFSYKNIGGILPECVAVWAGLDECAPTIKFGGLTKLHTENDRGMPFSEIADLIEAQL